MNRKGFISTLTFIIVLIVLAALIIGVSIYIRIYHPGLVSNLRTNQVQTKQSSSVVSSSSTLTENTPCIQFTYPSDFQLSPKSVITTTNAIKEGVSEYGSSVLVLEKANPGSQSFGIIISCLPSQWSNAQKSLSQSSLDMLKAQLNSDINSGREPVDRKLAKYDLTQSQAGNIQNRGNLTATKIIEVYYTDNDSLWSVKEDIYATFNNRFYRFTNTGSAKNEEDIKAEVKQFEDLFQTALLVNPVNK